MGGVIRLASGSSVLAAAVITAGIYLGNAGNSRQVSYVAPKLVPIEAETSILGDQPPTNPPAAVILPVPFTAQAPLGDWAAKQHTCEEASLAMVDRYLRGDHSGSHIDPRTAEAAINQITAWKPAVDLTPAEVGQLAQKHLGWAYEVLPADRLHMKQQLALGRPLIVGVPLTAWVSRTTRATALITSSPAGRCRTTSSSSAMTSRTRTSSTTRASPWV